MSKFPVRAYEYFVSEGRQRGIRCKNVPVSKTPEEIAAEKKRALRAALDGVELTPEITQDEMQPPAQDSNRDQEMVANKPPHHGS